jgi:hypothetical protein
MYINFGLYTLCRILLVQNGFLNILLTLYNDMNLPITTMLVCVPHARIYGPITPIQRVLYY